MAHRSPHQVPLSNAHWRKGNVQAAEMTLETVVGAEAAALPQPGSAPLQVPRAYLGKGWEARGSPGISLPNCLNSVASGSWNPDQMLVRLPGGTPGTHPQGVQSTKQRPGNRGSDNLLEAKSHTSGWEQGSRAAFSPDPGWGWWGPWDSQAPPSPPHPQPALLRSGAQ